MKEEVKYYENLRDEVKKHSGDAIDLKSYEPAMRHLIDSYIRAEESEKISEFDDMLLIELIVERGADATDALPEGVRKNKEAVAETIENNVRRLIIDENSINPKYYERMSVLLDDLVDARCRPAIEYQEYLEKVVALTGQAKNPTSAGSYPETVNTAAKSALYDNLNKDTVLALAVDKAVHDSRQDDWRGNRMKIKRVILAIKAVLGDDDLRVNDILELVTNQNEYLCIPTDDQWCGR